MGVRSQIRGKQKLGSRSQVRAKRNVDGDGMGLGWAGLGRITCLCMGWGVKRKTRILGSKSRAPIRRAW